MEDEQLIQVEIHGKQYPITYNMNTMIELAERTDLDFRAIGAADEKSLQEKMTLKNSLELIACCINEGYREQGIENSLTGRDIGALLVPMDYGLKKMQEIINTINKSIDRLIVSEKN